MNSVEHSIAAMWKPPIKNWDNASVQTYELMFSQSKERFEDLLSESESITNKAIAMLTVLISSIAALLIFKPIAILSHPTPVILLGLIFVWDVVTLFLLLFPKKIILRGSPPNELAWANFDKKDYSESDIAKAVYFNEIIQYQHKIDSMHRVNERRQSTYRTALILSILVIVGQLLLSIYFAPFVDVEVVAGAVVVGNSFV